MHLRETSQSFDRFSPSQAPGNSLRFYIFLQIKGQEEASLSVLVNVCCISFQKKPTLLS